MSRPLDEWDEEYVLGLPPGENDSFERKGVKKLDLTLPGVKEGEVLDELAKQLSAFANTDGGHIIYGLNNNGEVDNGGVTQSVKGKQLTKDWLESVIPNLTEYEVLGCNVLPIVRKADNSRIAEGKAIYVVEVPDSERAPHQSSRDQKYYIRLGGNSVPAPHRLVEDIRTRQRHPIVDLRKIELTVLSLPPFERHDPQTWMGDIGLRLHFDIKNTGRVMAKNTCLRTSSTFNQHWGPHNGLGVRLRGQSPREALWEFLDPIYPHMEVDFDFDASAFGGYGPVRAAAPWGGPWFLGQPGSEVSDCRLDWALFADNAPAKVGTVTMAELRFSENAVKTLRTGLGAARVFNAFPLLDR